MAIRRGGYLVSAVYSTKVIRMLDEAKGLFFMQPTASSLSP
jgi:hypothetical protein